MHTAPINRISTDRAGRLALTVSGDKTARLWELPSGRLLRVLRPPLGEGNEGKLYAGALSPDGTLAAVGGFTGATDKPETESIYFFNTTAGQLVHRLTGLPTGVADLAFSESGRWLAAGLGEGGIRLWEVASRREAASDSTYGASCYGLSWHGDTRLAASCYDGQVRLYRWAESERPSLALHPSCTTETKEGKRPFALRFSPDGRRLAVGFADSTKVTVLSGEDLSPLFVPNTSGVDNGNLSKVAWSADGITLAAGGRWDPNSDHPLRLWAEGGRGQGRNLVVATSTIMDLCPLPDGRLLYGAGDPAWGVVTLAAADRFIRHGAPPIADLRDNREGFRMSAGADIVAFSFSPFGKTPSTFDLAKRTLTLLSVAQTLPATLRPPRTEGLPITDWTSTIAPKLRGRPLKLLGYEMSHSLTIAADAAFFLLGTGWQLRCFSADGTARWNVAAPSAVWSVNLSADGRLAVAAYGDGTIRWHRVDNGKELLAFFPHADQQRWVLWTPQGYYDCSPGGEELIGWHVNRGKDRESDFFSAARFRNFYYRPDVISRVLQTRDVNEALRQANRVIRRPEAKPGEIGTVLARLAPPVVELVTGGVFGTETLVADATEVRVRYRVRQTGQEATSKVTIRFNGRLVDVAAPLPRANETAEVTVPLPAGMTGELSVLAEHRLATSEAALLRIERMPGRATPRQPNLYLIAVGVADLKMNDAADLNHDGRVTQEEINRSSLFKEGDLVLPNLVHAASDARRLVQAFQVQDGRSFGRVIARTLLDREATTAAVRDTIREVAKQAQPEDVAVVFFSGHGEVDAKVGYYLATYEADPKAPAVTALTGKELSSLLEGIKARTVLVLDTCHAGGAFGGTRLQRVVTSPNDLTGLVNELASAEQGTVVLSSSGATEQSLEDAEQGGVFTQAFREGLTNKSSATARSEPVTCRRMQDWLAKRVPELVKALVKGVPDAPRQTPVCVIPKGVPDFPIARP